MLLLLRARPSLPHHYLSITSQVRPHLGPDAETPQGRHQRHRMRRLRGLARVLFLVEGFPATLHQGTGAFIV